MIVPEPENAAQPSRRTPLRESTSNAPTNEWTTNRPVGDTNRLDVLLSATSGDVLDGEHWEALGPTLSVAVIQNGSLVAESYAETSGPGTQLVSWSMAKSFVHALVGMLVLDGRLDIDAPAPVPAWSAPDDARRTITTRQLLNMSSGLSFAEDYDPANAAGSDVIQMLFGDGKHDCAGFAESLPLAHTPDSVCSYSSGTSNILSAIVGRTVGGGEAGMRAFMNERLFAPIGITEADPRFDDVGTFIGSSFLYLSARDFARFGLLYLHDGVWNGTRLLPEGWVEFARTPVENDPACPFWYGAHWWLWDDEFAAFSANGYEGQHIVVVPERDLVLVRLGKTADGSQHVVHEWMRQVIRCFPVL